MIKNLNISIYLALISLMLYFILNHFIDIPPASLKFYSEIVAATLTQDSKILINGEYHFLSNHNRIQNYRLGFPINENSKYRNFEIIEVLENDKLKDYKKFSQGIEIDILIEPMQECILKIIYKLPIKEGKVIYITKTANIWKDPISKATFILSAGLKSNYHKKGEQKSVFYKFKPKENWVIEVE